MSFSESIDRSLIGSFYYSSSFLPEHLDNVFFADPYKATDTKLINQKGIFPDLIQNTLTKNPDSTVKGILTFDGVDDYYTNDTSNTATYVKQTQMPDASGSDTGKGFTCTGLSRDSEGYWWFANFGLNKNGSSGQQPSLVKTDKYLNLQKEVLLKPIDSSITGVQGVQIEKATGNAWVAVSDLGKIYVIDTDEEKLIASYTVDALPNGIALDEANQRFFILYVNGNSTPIVKSYNMQNGSFIEEFTGFTGLTFGDHIFYDENTEILWVITGSNAYNAGRLYAYSTKLGTISNSVGLMEGDAVEGIYLDFPTNKLYVANDAYFHELDINAGGDSTLKNSLLEYDFDASYINAVYSDTLPELEINCVLDCFSMPSASVIYQIDDPLNTNSGISIYAANSTTIRIFIGSGTGWESFDFTLKTNFSLSSSSPVYSQLTVKLDFTNKLIRCFQDGVQLGAPQSWTGALTKLTYAKASMGASAVPDRYLGFHLKEFAVTDALRSSTAINNLGNYWANRHGLNYTEQANWADEDSLKLDGVAPSFIVQFDKQKYAINGIDKTDSIFTFTRASTATYRASDGLLKTAVTNEMRFEYDENGNALGYLNEDAATNLIKQSNDMDSTWVKNGSATVTVNNLTSPDGTMNADTVNMQTAAWSGLYQSASNISVTAGEDYAIQFRIKNISGGTSLYLGSDSSNFGSNTAAKLKFDAVTKTFSSVGSAIKDYGYVEYTLAGENWIYVYLVATATADGGAAVIMYNASGVVSSWGLWGIQFEAGSKPTSLIYTTGSAVTRAKDILKIDGTNFSDFWNATKGTIYVDALQRDALQKEFFISATGSTVSERVLILNHEVNVGQMRFVVDDGFARQADIYTPVGADQSNLFKKIAAAYELNNFNVSYDGNIATTDTSGTVPVVNQLHIGNELGSWQLNGIIKEIRVYPVRGLNASLQTLTQ